MNKQINANDALKTKKAFEECRLEVISFDCKDVITASTQSDDCVGISSVCNDIFNKS